MLHILLKLANDLDENGLYYEANILDLFLKNASTSENVENYIYDLKESLKQANIDQDTLSYVFKVIDKLSNEGNYARIPASLTLPDEITGLVEGALELERSIRDTRQQLQETKDETKRNELENLLEEEQSNYLKLLEKVHNRRKNDPDRGRQFGEMLMKRRHEKGWH